MDAQLTRITLHGAPVSVQHCSTVAVSYLCSKYVLNQSLLVSPSGFHTANLTFSWPTFAYTVQFNLFVADDLPSDIVVGDDFRTLCVNSALPRLVDSLPKTSCSTFPLVSLPAIIPCGPCAPSTSLNSEQHVFRTGFEITPQPVTPQPITPLPITPLPITPLPITPLPITPLPITPLPITPLPITPLPITPLPITPQPDNNSMLHVSRPSSSVSHKNTSSPARGASSSGPSNIVAPFNGLSGFPVSVVPCSSLLIRDTLCGHYETGLVSRI